MNDNKLKSKGAITADLNNSIFLFNNLSSTDFLEELREIDKHEIIVKILKLLGDSPDNFNIAENIFELMKYDISNYVIQHEYCTNYEISEELLLWLDSSTNPNKADDLGVFLKKLINE